MTAYLTLPSPPPSLSLFPSSFSLSLSLSLSLSPSLSLSLSLSLPLPPRGSCPVLGLVDIPLWWISKVPAPRLNPILSSEGPMQEAASFLSPTVSIRVTEWLRKDKCTVCLTGAIQSPWSTSKNADTLQRKKDVAKSNVCNLGNNDPILKIRTGFCFDYYFSLSLPLNVPTSDTISSFRPNHCCTVPQ